MFFVFNLIDPLGSDYVGLFQRAELMEVISDCIDHHFYYNFSRRCYGQVQ